MNELASEKYIFTGGPGAGKTTVLDALKTRGYHCSPDVARAIIKSRLESGLEPRPEPPKFARDIFENEVANYLSTPSDEICLFDRGIVDALAMLHSSNPITMEDVGAYLRQYPYNRNVFYFPPWKKIYRTDEERDQSWEESVAVSESVKQWYLRCNYRLVEVPTGTVSERAAFIENTIGIKSSI